MNLNPVYKMMSWCNYIVGGMLVLLFSCKEKQGDHAHHTMHDTVTALTASPSKVVVSGQSTIRPAMINASAKKSFNGIIAADEARHNKVAVRVGGRIEKLYAKFNYQAIKAGSPVMEIYSPELNRASEEYLLLYNSNTNKPLLANSREKLKLMGLSGAQISSIEKNGKVPGTFTVFSPYGGYLFPGDGEMKQGSNTGESNIDMSEMGGTEPLDESYTASVIREGAYVNKGQTLFTVNDLQRVWALLTIDPGFAINKGDSVLLHIGNDDIIAVIGFMEPYYRSGQKFSRVRIYLENKTGKYKLNDIFTAELLQPKGNNVLSVPARSILDLGARKIVWVKTGKVGQNNLFEARTVTTGRSGNGLVEILSGLREDEEIAEAAGFMVDRESLIKQ
jgi:membrane fusion protein, copper/silver efflux system